MIRSVERAGTLSSDPASETAERPSAASGAGRQPPPRLSQELAGLPGQVRRRAADARILAFRHSDGSPGQLLVGRQQGPALDSEAQCLLDDALDAVHTVWARKEQVRGLDGVYEFEASSTDYQQVALPEAGPEFVVQLQVRGGVLVAAQVSSEIDDVRARFARVQASGAGSSAHVDDEALVRAYQAASSTAQHTAAAHASYLRHLAGWLRATPDDTGRPRPTLGELRAELVGSGQRARDNVHVQAFRQTVGERSAAGEHIAGALDALVRGNTARQVAPGQVDDEALVDAYQAASSTRPGTAAAHAKHLRHLAGWLRATPDEAGRSRPTLGELRAELVGSGQRARNNVHVQAFRRAAGERSATGGHIAGALDALVRGNTAQQVAPGHADDEALVRAYLEASSTRPGTATAHALHLRYLARWLRATPDDAGRARPTLGELRAELVGSGQRARDNVHVQAFRQTVGERSTTGGHIAGALDALVRGNTAR